MSVIGVPLRHYTNGNAPPKLGLNRTYFDALENAGATPLPIPIIQDKDRLRIYYELLDGLLLPGGADVDPGRYGVALRKDCHVNVVPELDEVELTIARWAIEDGLPVLGICRGIQILNVVEGGSLWQDLKIEGATREEHHREPRDVPAHGLEIEPESLMARTIGSAHVQVNTLHHQAIRNLGSSLRAVALTPDGLVEGVEIPGHEFVLGIQCHPEELFGKEEWAARLFAGLVESAGRYHKAHDREVSRA